jgi:SAM-dependent methyltransferase
MRRSKGKLVFGIPLSVGYLLAALFVSTPGLCFHAYSVLKGCYLLVRSRLDKKSAGAMVLFPMDSFRYFEFDFFWQSIAKRKALGDYLDVSSPRLFSLRALGRHCFKSAVLVNPVVDDLTATKQLIAACGLSGRCVFRGCVLENLEWASHSFDTIVCISVVEHIPGEGDRVAVEKMWELLRPGGMLLLSVPCCRESFEEYIDFNEYGLVRADEEGFVFGQRFYSQEMLEERIYCVTGRPSRFGVYGEMEKGTFERNRAQKLSGLGYPYWREPFMMGEEYSYFGSIRELPGWGVAAMEFFKN